MVTLFSARSRFAHVLARLRAFRADAGQSMVELALLLPVLVFGLIGGADLARAYALQLGVQHGARAGAEGSAIAFAKSTPAAAQRAKDEMGRTPGLTCDFVHACTVLVTIADDEGDDCEVSPPT